MKTYYEILKVNFTDSKDTIKRNYEELVSIAKGYSDHFGIVLLNEAYETLSSDSRRVVYDSKLSFKQIRRIDEVNILFDDALRSFNRLSAYIGNLVHVTYIENSRVRHIISTLLDVDYFNSIKLKDEEIPFIGDVAGIIKIKDITTREVIYSNRNISPYGYDGIRQKKEVMNASWGDIDADIKYKIMYGDGGSSYTYKRSGE